MSEIGITSPSFQMMDCSDYSSEDERIYGPKDEYSDEYEDDIDLVEQCLCEVEENWDISEADEYQMTRFLRENNYDTDILIEELQTGAFGPFAPKYDYEIEISKNGKPVLNKYRSLQPNYQKAKNKPQQSQVKAPVQRDPSVEEPKIVRTLFTGPKGSGKTTISNIVSLGSNPFNTIQHQILYEEGETMDQFQHSELIIIVTSINEDIEKEKIYYQLAQASEAPYVIVLVNKMDEVPKQYQEESFKNKKRNIQRMVHKKYDNFLGIIPVSAKDGIGLRTVNYPFYDLNPLKLMIELVDKKPIVIEDDFYLAADHTVSIEKGIAKISGYVFGGFIRLAEEVSILPERIEGTVVAIEPQKKCATKWSYTTLTIKTKEVQDKIVENAFVAVSPIQFPLGRIIKFKPLGFLKKFTDNFEFVAEFAHCKVGGTVAGYSKKDGNNVIAYLHEKICLVPQYSMFILHTREASIVCHILDVSDKGFGKKQ